MMKNFITKFSMMNSKQAHEVNYFSCGFAKRIYRVLVRVFVCVHMCVCVFPCVCVFLHDSSKRN